MGTFHFLRPWWLLLVPAGLALVWVWRRRDGHQEWRSLIAPHLLEALLVGEKGGFRVKPVHLVGAALALGGLSAAGPTWKTEPPPFAEDRAPMIVALDLSSTMDATDVPPTRLERVKQKIRDLTRKRQGARTGLVVYAGTAHLVLPPAEDPALMELFLEALDTSLMPRPGRNAEAALDLAVQLLKKEPAAGTVLFFTDGFDTEQSSSFPAKGKTETTQILILGVGTSEGGPLRTRSGGVATDPSGVPVLARFDRHALEEVAHRASIPLASVTLDDSDLDWVQRRAQRHLEEVEARKAEVRWEETGYWLTFPIVLLVALWFRRGWVVHWASVVILVVALGLDRPALAADSSPERSSTVVRWMVGVFLTPDQQGRWYFERGYYREAGARFQDPMWKGLALLRAGDPGAALGEFARLRSPEAFFWMGNCNARLGRYPAAVVAYDNALAKRPVFPEASANRSLVSGLIPKPKESREDAHDPNLRPDEIKFDEQGKQGKSGRVDAAKVKAQQAELWMRNLSISPGAFLRQKFAIQAEHQPQKEKAR